MTGADDRRGSDASDSGPPTPSVFALIFWPTVVTLAINLARFATEISGVVTTASGGAAHPLGIGWLPFAFGGWFAFRLTQTGRGPDVQHAVIASFAALAILVVAILVGLGSAAARTGDFGSLRGRVVVIAGVAAVLAVFASLVWRRLAYCLLIYAIPARLTVLVFTLVAALGGFDTHYTKLGPAGIELESVAETMLATSFAQIVFWIPYTILSGLLAGTLIHRIVRDRTART